MEDLIIKHIVYYDYGGSHTSVTAAGIHAGMLKPYSLPNRDDLLAIPYLDKTTPEDFGKVKHMGTDEKGNEIYTLGTKYSHSMALLDDMASLLDTSSQFVFLNTSPYVNTILRIGGWLSRSVSLPALGRPLVVKGLQEAYPSLCSLVETVKVKQEGTGQ